MEHLVHGGEKFLGGEGLEEEGGVGQFAGELLVFAQAAGRDDVMQI